MVRLEGRRVFFWETGVLVSRPGADFELQVVCKQWSVPASAAAKYMTSPNAAAYNVMSWVQSCGASSVSVASSAEEGKLMFGLDIHSPEVLLFSSCCHLVAALNDVKALLPASSLPAFTCIDLQGHGNQYKIKFMEVV